ncbi:MAG: non-canonical purine NTP pyrophosphatase [Gemmatimonadota bacterium]|nr:non-canonical purine NTP pyrophosphatase [Gemmatimonadota bacterium]
MAVERQFLLATRNPGKLRELIGILEKFDLVCVSADDAGIQRTPEEETVESFDSFEENALAKARYFFKLSGGLPVLADDSGLCVSALGGAPGVWSKRYSGRSDLDGPALDDANNAALLSALRALARDASYRCAAAYVDGANELVAVGETRGRIVDEPAGTEGFGYDSYFLSAELGCTFGEAPIDAKAGISHRGLAFRKLLGTLRERGLLPLSDSG